MISMMVVYDFPAMKPGWHRIRVEGRVKKKQEKRF